MLVCVAAGDDFQPGLGLGCCFMQLDMLLYAALYVVLLEAG